MGSTRLQRTRRPSIVAVGVDSFVTVPHRLNKVVDDAVPCVEYLVQILQSLRVPLEYIALGARNDAWDSEVEVQDLVDHRENENVLFYRVLARVCLQLLDEEAHEERSCLRARLVIP